MCAGLLAMPIAGCTHSLGSLSDVTESSMFSKPADIFVKPSWASSTINDNNVQLSPRAPVAPEELVGADGRCGASVARSRAGTGGDAGSAARAAGRPAGRLYRR